MDRQKSSCCTCSYASRPTRAAGAAEGAPSARATPRPSTIASRDSRLTRVMNEGPMSVASVGVCVRQNLTSLTNSLAPRATPTARAHCSRASLRSSSGPTPEPTTTHSSPPGAPPLSTAGLTQQRGLHNSPLCPQYRTQRDEGGSTALSSELQRALGVQHSALAPKKFNRLHRSLTRFAGESRGRGWHGGPASPRST